MPSRLTPRQVRSSAKWRKLAARVYREETHCHICGRWVDQTLPPCTPESRAADHVVPLFKGGEPYDRANVRLAHTRCNAERNRRKPPPPVVAEAVGATHQW